MQSVLPLGSIAGDEIARASSFTFLRASKRSGIINRREPSKRPRAASSVTAKTKAGYSFCSMRKHSFIVAKRNPSLFLFNASSDLAPHRRKA